MGVDQSAMIKGVGDHARPLQPAFPNGASFPDPDFLAGLIGDHFGFWRINPEIGLIECDAQAAQLLGLAALGPVPIDLPQVTGFAGPVLAASQDQGAGGSIALELPVDEHGARRWVEVLGRTGPDGAPVTGIVRDITRHKVSEQTAIERGRRLASIVNDLPGVCYFREVAPPWRVTFINAEVERLTGFAPSSFLQGGKTWDSLIHPDDRLMVRTSVEQAIAAERRFHVRYRIFDQQDRVHWVYERGRARPCGDGEPTEIEGFILDVTSPVQKHEQLGQSEERFRLVCQATTDAVYENDLLSRQIVCHADFEGFLGYEIRSLPTERDWWLGRIHPDDLGRVVRQQTGHMAGDTTKFTTEYRLARADGSYAEIRQTAVILRGPSGKPYRLIGAIQDLSRARAMSKALEESEALNRSIVDASQDCIKLLDLGGRLQFINDFGAKALGVGDAELLYGRSIASLWPKEARRRIHRAVARARAGRTGRFSGQCPMLDGTVRAWDVIISPINDSTGKPVKLMAISRDISERLENEKRLFEAATLDPLTGLPNRRHFVTTLEEMIVTATARKSRFGLLLLDLDGFKQINDTIGHDAGDAVLCTVAERLAAITSAKVKCARLAGDEFAVIVGDIASGEQLARFADRLSQALKQPFTYANRLLDCHGTIGTAVWPANGLTSSELLKAADTALYVAKRNHPGTVMPFVAEHRAELRRQSTMIRRAREALRRDAIQPFYQPIVSLGDGRIAGYEALLRLRRPGSTTTLNPAAIMAAFDDPELSTAISQAMQGAVARDMAAWLDDGVTFGQVAINATEADLRQEQFAEGLLAMLDNVKVPPQRLRIEVTETVFLGRGSEGVLRSLQTLSASGVSVTLDDFGTGHASLVHLRDLPVQGLKIDCSFVARMLSDERDMAVIEAVVNLGKRIGLEVTAEGVEHARQVDELLMLGCNLAQGYLFSPAVPAATVQEKWRSGQILERPFCLQALLI